MAHTTRIRSAALGLVTVLMAALPSVTSIPATSAAETDALNIGFNGSLVGTTAYTTAGSEIMRGMAHRADGAEAQDPTVGVRLGGGRQGIIFDASTLNLGDGSTATTGFIAEVKFTPAATQGSLATLFAAGGGLQVRYQDGLLRYGYDSFTDGSWVSNTQTVRVPAAGTEHAFSLQYLPGTTGTRLVAYLDGVAQPEVTSPDPASLNPDLRSRFGFGNDVHPQALTRGFTGSLRQVRVAPGTATFETSNFELQPSGPTTPPEQPCEPKTYEPANTIPVTATDCAANLVKAASALRPTEQQWAWQEHNLSAFIHFGINTFYNQEWGHGTEDPAKFNPTGPVDTDAWVKALADAGFRRVIYTVKHHDGFAMWQSRYTDFGVKASPWLGGEGDVVKMLAASAKKYGLELGLYISPADSYQEIQGVFANGSPKKTRTIPTLVDGDDRAGKDLPTFTYEATDYGALFLNQVYELMTEYGPIAEVWFDGAQGNTGRVEPYDFTAFYDLIEKLQPNALTAIEGEGVRWIGNEEGVARVNESSTIPTVRKPTGALKFAYDSPSLGSDGQIATAVQTQGMTELRWFPGEADFKMTQGWFAHPTDTPKTPAELLGLYNRSVGRNAVYLMNIPPTTTGSFAPASAQSLAGFGAERAKAYTKNVAIGAPVTVSDATGSTTTTAVTDGNHLTGAGTGRAAPTAYEVTLPQATEVNSIQLAEATRSNGQQVTGFTVEAEQNGAWIQVGAAGTIGASRIISFPSAVTASRFRVTVTGSRAPVQLSEIALYQQDPNATVAMSQAWLDCSAPTAGDGSQARPFNTVEQLRYVTMAPGSTLNVKAGADCGASTARLWGYGTADAPVTVALYGGTTAPRVGDVPLAEFLTPYVAQGWNLSGLTSPTAS